MAIDHTGNWILSRKPSVETRIPGTARVREAAGCPGANSDFCGSDKDEPPAGWKLANHASAGRVMPQLLAGDGAFLDGECAAELQHWLADVPRGDAVTLTVTRKAVTPAENQLVYCPQDMMLGLGCARGCSG